MGRTPMLGWEALGADPGEAAGRFRGRPGEAMDRLPGGSEGFRWRHPCLGVTPLKRAALKHDSGQENGTVLAPRKWARIWARAQFQARLSGPNFRPVIRHTMPP